MRIRPGGSFTTIIEGLNQPTSFEFIGDTAYVVSINGEVWRIDNISPAAK